MVGACFWVCTDFFLTFPYFAFFIIEQQKDLQWRLAVIQMFSANAIEVFITLFIKLGENLALLWKQNEPFTNSQCFILVNITMTLLELTDTLLSHSLTTSFGFKDVRLIQQLFVLHKVLCSKPPAGILSSVLANIQDGIIELLRKFMKFTSNTPESEEGKKIHIFLSHISFYVLFHNSYFWRANGTFPESDIENF